MVSSAVEMLQKLCGIKTPAQSPVPTIHRTDFTNDLFLEACVVHTHGQDLPAAGESGSLPAIVSENGRTVLGVHKRKQ
jgi:hypothetical protein